MSEDKKPNFFIVGAPKCGTSTMFHYLEQHPDIFMYPRKEPDFFAEDLKAPEHRHGYSQEAWDAYLRMFRPAGSEAVIGEGTTWYLYSREAASRIHDFNRDARILIMLRNPADQMHSLHSQLVYMGVEKTGSFEDALRAGADRANSRHTCLRYMPPTMTNGKLIYKEIAKFADQIQRYLDVFGPDQVRVVLIDDLKKNPADVYRGVLEFLEVDPTFEPDYRTFNPNKTRRIKTDVIQRFRTHPVNQWLVRSLIPARVREESFRALAHAWGALNTKYHPREPMKESLRAELEAEFLPEIQKLEAMLDRDLSHWTRSKTTHSC